MVWEAVEHMVSSKESWLLKLFTGWTHDNHAVQTGYYYITYCLLFLTDDANASFMCYLFIHSFVCSILMYGPLTTEPSPY